MDLVIRDLFLTTNEFDFPALQASYQPTRHRSPQRTATSIWTVIIIPSLVNILLCISVSCRGVYIHACMQPLPICGQPSAHHHQFSYFILCTKFTTSSRAQGKRLPPVSRSLVILYGIPKKRGTCLRWPGVWLGVRAGRLYCLGLSHYPTFKNQDFPGGGYSQALFGR